MVNLQGICTQREDKATSGGVEVKGKRIPESLLRKSPLSMNQPTAPVSQAKFPSRGQAEGMNTWERRNPLSLTKRFNSSPGTSCNAMAQQFLLKERNSPYLVLMSLVNLAVVISSLVCLGSLYKSEWNWTVSPDGQATKNFFHFLSATLSERGENSTHSCPTFPRTHGPTSLWRNVPQVTIHMPTLFPPGLL